VEEDPAAEEEDSYVPRRGAAVHDAKEARARLLALEACEKRMGLSKTSWEEEEHLASLRYMIIMYIIISINSRAAAIQTERGKFHDAVTNAKRNTTASAHLSIFLFVYVSVEGGGGGGFARGGYWLVWKLRVRPVGLVR